MSPVPSTQCAAGYGTPARCTGREECRESGGGNDSSGERQAAAERENGVSEPSPESSVRRRSLCDVIIGNKRRCSPGKSPGPHLVDGPHPPAGAAHAALPAASVAQTW